MSTSFAPTLTVDFAGELSRPDPASVFVIGRSGDLEIDDNPYLHRSFLEISFADGMWWVANIGTRLAAHLTDSRGIMRTTLAAGARQPLVFPLTLLTFTAGSTSYELLLEIDGAIYQPQRPERDASGDTTIAPGDFTVSQKVALLALAEPLLRRVGTGASKVPSAVEAASRLGWAQTRFNRKLDNICEKLERAGVQGLRGEVGSSAANRRVVLVEYAVSTLLVTADDLPLLDREAARARAEGALS